MDRAPESLTSRQSLPDSWVAKIFQTMQGNYGSRFLNMWKTGQVLDDGTDVGVQNAMVVWGEKLSGFADQPERIKRVLETLPPDPPSLPQFIELCRFYPKNQRQALPHKQTPEERERSHYAAAEIAKFLKKDDFDHLLWAKRPRSQVAVDFVIDGAKTDIRLRNILDGLIESGVVSEKGKLLRTPDGRTIS